MGVCVYDVHSVTVGMKRFLGLVKYVLVRSRELILWYVLGIFQIPTSGVYERTVLPIDCVPRVPLPNYPPIKHSVRLPNS